MIRLLRFDALALLRDRLALAALIVGLLAALLAVVAGSGWAHSLASDHAVNAAEAGAARIEARAAWASASTLPPEEAVLLPSRLATPLQLAPPLLPDFSIGRSSLEPVAATVRLATRPDGLFTRYEVGNAERLARGGFDLGFVAVVLAPLLLIGLGYGVFVSDRDTGTARLWLAQAGSPFRLLAARSLNRMALVFLPVLIAAIALAMVGPDFGARASSVALWSGIALLGLLFWWAVILAVNSFAIAAETAALVLVGLWALLVFVLPVVATTSAALIDPPPSRFEQIAAARAAEVQASRAYDDDHPELSNTSLKGRLGGVLKGVEVRRNIAQAVAPVAQTYEDRLAGQRRFVDQLSYLSPPALVATSLTRIARTDVDSYAQQRGAASAYLEPLGRALATASVKSSAIDASVFDALPRFVAPKPAPPSLGPALWLAIVTLLIGGWAISRLRRARPI